MSGQRRTAALAALCLALVAGVVALTVLWRRSADRDELAPQPAPRKASTRIARRAPLGPVHLSGGVSEKTGKDALGSFSGRVLSSADLSPVRAAEITFLAGGTAHSVVCDDSGAFSFLPPAEGTYRIQSIAAEGYFPFSSELGASPLVLVARRGSAIKNVTLYLAPAIAYEVRVVDPRGAPVASAEVRVLDALGEPAASSEPRIADGNGELGLTAFDGAILEARHTSFAPGRARIDFAAQVSRRVTIRMGERSASEPALAISGRVQDERGTPIAGIFVTATPEKSGPSDRPVLGARARTELDGSFAIEGLAATSHALFAEEPGAGSVLKRGVVAPASGVVLVLAPGSTLVGRVVSAETGEPISGFTIVVSERLGALARDTVRAETAFDPDGRYRIEDLARGRYQVLAAAQGYAPSAEREISLGDAETTADFALERGATLSGTVLDADTRAPIERAKISLEGRARPGAAERGVPLLAVAISDARGQFLLGGLPLGEHSLLVAASEHHGKIVGPFVVRGSERIGPIEVLLSATRDGEQPRIELFGIGAVLTAHGEVLRIERVVDGGGAAEMELAIGDEILSIDGVPVTALGFEGAVQRIRGPEGSAVLLSVVRAGAAPFFVAVPRRRIRA